MPPPRRSRPDRLPTGTVSPRTAGAPWWRYQRPQAPAPITDRRRVESTVDASHAEGVAEPTEAPETTPSRRTGLEQASGNQRAGAVPGILAACCFAVVILTARLEIAAIGLVLVPAGAILAALALGQVIARRHPDEQWMTWLLVIGIAAKLIASAIRYYTIVDEFGGGDAEIYDIWGSRYYEYWTGGGDEPDTMGKGSAETNWVRWFTGIVYVVFGPNIIVAFLVFGLLAAIGSYFWYRAAADAVPFLDKRLYFALVFFAPSIMYWPSSIGKEALMQLGVGGLTLATAKVMTNRLLTGLIIALPAGWLVWRVRPHLLAIAAFAAGIAYLFGRVRRSEALSSTSLLRPIGMVVVAFLVFFAISEGAQFLGMEQFSLSSLEAELEETSETTAQGGSQFDSGGGSLTPLTLPQGAMTVLLRPFPWEVETGLQILASLEGAAIAVYIVHRRRSLALSLRRARTTPFLLYCWTFVLVYAVAFSAISNFGNLVRQRALILAALFVLLALDTKRAARESPPPDSRDLGLTGRR